MFFLPGCDEAKACDTADRIRSSAQAASLVNAAARAAPYVTISIGVAAVRPGDCVMSADDLQQTADACLYLAKKQGRNRVVIDRAPQT